MYRSRDEDMRGCEFAGLRGSEGLCAGVTGGTWFAREGGKDKVCAGRVGDVICAGRMGRTSSRGMNGETKFTREDGEKMIYAGRAG